MTGTVSEFCAIVEVALEHSRVLAINVAQFSLQTILVLKVYNVHIVLGWSEVKTVQQKIASTREC